MNTIKYEFDDTQFKEQLEHELHREIFKAKYMKTLRSSFFALVISAAVAVLIATFVLPVLQIYGSSMQPTLQEGDVAVSVKLKKFEYGDVISFYYSNKILVKRVIGKPLDLINIDADGNVYVNGEILNEPYIKEKSQGETDLEYPFRVPEGSYFVIGDQRESSIDSRMSSVGCISHEEIVGKILFVAWPIKHFGGID